jgi:hypothetical protein
MTTATSAVPAERRIAPRFRPAFGTVYRIAAQNGVPAMVGLVWNISETGVSMLLADPPECGTRLEGELAPETGDGPALAIAIRVVHVHEMPNGDSFLGAQFARPLTPDELQAFLAPPLPAATAPPKPAQPNGAQEAK